MKKILIAFAGFCAFTAHAQIGDYLGPGILTRGSSGIGMRSGEQVDLRFYADVSGVYDTGLQPFSLNSNGSLQQINGLYGEQVSFGAYGTHVWRQASLGLDYTGNFYNYQNGSNYDGSSHNLALGYNYQKSQRLSFHMQAIAGTTSLGSLAGSTYVPTSTDVVYQPTTQLFDNRIYYVQGTLGVTIVQSARTSYSIGGEWYLVRRDTSALAGLDGYGLNGTVRHRLSKTRSIGLTYGHSHYDFSNFYGQSDVNTMQAFLIGSLGRRFTYSVAGGAFEAEVTGVQNVALSPVIAALLGQSYTTVAFYHQQISPSGSGTLSGQLGKSSSLSIGYSRAVMPGNGLYLTSSMQSGGASYSYTGIRKWNLGMNAGYSSLSAIGQNLQSYHAATAGVGATYGLTRTIHVIGRYDARQQEIDVVGYRHVGYRLTLGLGFSPGDIPLSLW